jgi:hypothetical protein
VLGDLFKMLGEGQKTRNGEVRSKKAS